MLEKKVVPSEIATFHHAEFSDISALVASKKRQQLKVSLCVPTLNEEDTIGEVVTVLREALQEKHALLDEIAVMDSGSSDRTREVAAAAGAHVYLASKILPECGEAAGKGENIWKSVHQLRGDIICFVDGDVRNMHPRFVTGPLGALLSHPRLQYVKAFYDRAHAAVEVGTRPIGGGRVTEALVRPLFSLFFPELAGVIQPLSGEYAARRDVLETLAMPSGYGVETAHLIDVLQSRGVEAIGQCDLDERLHRHQDTAALGRMSFAILHAFFQRAQKAGVVSVTQDLRSVYRHFVRDEGACRALDWEWRDVERPPLLDVPAYRERRTS